MSFLTKFIYEISYIMFLDDFLEVLASRTKVLDEFLEVLASLFDNGVLLSS